MADENKRFLDKVGVQYLWDKINEYFSQIGHRHETSDVNGLDEYMEENARAIKDTKKVVEELPELPLYPTEEQLGIIYEYDGKLYRGKKLPKLILDFSQIEDDGEGNVTTEIMRDFINKNGLNIVMEYYREDIEEIANDFASRTCQKYNSGIYISNYFSFHFEGRNFSEEFNHWNNIYVKSLKITAQSPYSTDNEETYQGCVEYSFDDHNDSSIDNEWWLSDSYPPNVQNNEFNFGLGQDINLADYVNLHTDNEGCPFTLLKLELELVTCNNIDEYNGGITHDFLVWEEVSEEELPVEDATPATEDTRKRFYREVDNDNIYVTDAEYNPGEGGFIIDIVHPRTGQQINSEELLGYIDPNNVWINSVDNSELIYADNRYWNNEKGDRVTITPIRIGTNRSAGYIQLSTMLDVDLYFSPYISFNSTTQQAVVEQTDTTVTIYDADTDETYDYDIEVYDNINLLEDKWTIVHVPVSSEVYINTSRRCYLHKIIKKGEGEGDRYFWSQIAKIQDIDDRINALPEVARTGNYSDLFNKPCIGDVQVYDWAKNDELPIIDEGTGNCDNRLKQLLRYDNSLYTAVVNDSGVSIDMREFSNKYTSTKPEVQGPLTEYTFKTRMDLRSTAAYEDYYVSGSKYMIQNTKGIGLQLGSSSDYGELVIAMRDYDDSKRMLFNNIEVGLQSWSSDGEKTTDNGNVYVEIGTTEYNETQREVDVESNLILIYNCNQDEFWCLCNSDLSDLSQEGLGEVLSASGYTITINGNTYHIDGFEEVYDDDRNITYCHVWLDNYDNLDSDWACDTWNDYSGGYDVAFIKTVTEHEQVLTPQQTKNVWFKRYSDEYVEEWVDTNRYWTEFDEGVPSEDYIRYYVYDDNTGDYAYEFLESLEQNQVLKIDGTEVIVKEISPEEGYLYIHYSDNYPNGYISILQRTYINNPLLRETVSLRGTNCDYIKIWTEYKDEQYGRRCVIKNITFNDIKYEFDEEPRYNRVFYRKDYWKQISGNGSIKVIDLTGDE